jgi:hypothetical protein
VAKISRPVLYTVIVGAIAYAGVVLTEPKAPPAKKAPPRTTHTAATATDAGSNITPEDLTARFTRYEPQKKAHDPFLPHVVTAHALAAAATAAGGSGGALSAGRGSWVLTGISAIDGTRSALLENGSTGESVFLKAGDKWNDLRVADVGVQSVAFVNAAGQRTELGFPELDDQQKAGGTPPPNPGMGNTGGAGAPSPTGQAGLPPAAPNNGGVPPAQLASGQPGGTNGS